MTIKNISELEFIGESLPKINENFSSLDTRANSLEANSTQYSNLSAFYSTHSNNSGIQYKTGNAQQQFAQHLYTKNQVYKDLSYAGMSDSQVSNVIYPATFYIKVVNSSEVADVNLIIKVKPSQTSSEVTLLNTKISSRASGPTESQWATQLVTFEDIGFYDWTLSFSGAGCQTNLYWTIKYLN